MISVVYKEKFAPRGRSRLDNCAKVSACKLRMPDTCVVVPTRYKSFLCKLLELKKRILPDTIFPEFLFRNSFPKLRTSHQRFQPFSHFFFTAINLLIFGYEAFAVNVRRYFRIRVIYQKKDGWRVGLNASAGDTGIFSVPAATQFNKRECPLSIHLFLINYGNQICPSYS